MSQIKPGSDEQSRESAAYQHGDQKTDKPILMCLCPVCAKPFYNSKEHFIIRADQNQTIKETCMFCNVRQGYDYLIRKKYYESFQYRRKVKVENEKILLNVEETANYLNLGKTKTRELMKENEKIFVVKIGNRNYAHKILLDKWLLAQVRK